MVPPEFFLSLGNNRALAEQGCAAIYVMHLG